MSTQLSNPQRAFLCFGICWKLKLSWCLPRICKNIRQSAEVVNFFEGSDCRSCMNESSQRVQPFESHSAHSCIYRDFVNNWDLASLPNTIFNVGISNNKRLSDNCHQNWSSFLIGNVIENKSNDYLGERHPHFCRFHLFFNNDQHYCHCYICCQFTI